jgi:GNAT superfamily N-acetyltransferase
MDPSGPASAAAAAHHAPHEPYVIRSFRREDIAACTQLYVEGLLGGRIAENDTGLDIDDIDRAYMNKPGSHFWIAETVAPLADSGGAAAAGTKQVIGMIGVQQHEDNVGEIRRLRVRQDFRRRGIGSALVETALKFCRDRGYLKIALDTFMEREPAVRLFEKFHFRHSRTRNVMGKEVMHFYLDLYQRDGGQGGQGQGGPHGQPDAHDQHGMDARP